MPSENFASSDGKATPWQFSRFWALAALTLITVTFRLWFPDNCFPLIPFFGLGHGAATSLTMLSGPLIVAPLLWIVVQPLNRSWRWWLVVGGLLIAFLSDQHRLQPWAYQTVLYAVIFAFTPQRNHRRWVIPIAASIYLYSSAGKFDYQFTHTVGQDFLQALLGSTGILQSERVADSRHAIALIFPAVEFLLGLGLLLPPTRRVAGIGVIAMHATLLMILGPFGLNHSYGVLVWNIALAVQAWMIFVRPDPARVNAKGAEQHPPSTKQIIDSQFSKPQSQPLLKTTVVGLVCGFALLAPLGERSGYWDHWLSWALYSPHNSRVVCEVSQSAVDKLPESLQQYLKEDADEDGWREVDFGAWSLECTGAPIYPQSRYQRQLAADLAVNHRLNSSVRAIVYETADRWTGERKTQWLLGTSELVPSKPKRRWQ